MVWSSAISAFLASIVEFVEALTIVLVVGATVNWKTALAGAAAAVLTLAGLVAVFGTSLVTLVPIEVLRLIVGVILVLFGLKWLKKAIMRYSGLKALHDEEAIYEEEMRAMKARGETLPRQLDRFGFATSYKSVLLEGLEVAFVVISLGTSAAKVDQEKGNTLAAAAIGASVAGLLVIVVGGLVRGPLTRVPENTLKFSVGIMLTSFGIFWAGEGLGVTWFAGDISLLGLIVACLLMSASLIMWLRPYGQLKLEKTVAQAENFEQEGLLAQQDPLAPLRKEKLS